MAGFAGTDFLISGIGRIAAQVANGGGVNARNLPEDSLGAPETTEPEIGNLEIRGKWPLDGGAQDRMGAGNIESGRFAAGLESGTWVRAYRGGMTTNDQAWVPEACTLPTAERPSLLLGVTTHLRGRAFLVKSLDQDMTVTRADFAKAFATR